MQKTVEIPGRCICTFWLLDVEPSAVAEDDDVEAESECEVLGVAEGVDEVGVSPPSS